MQRATTSSWPGQAAAGRRPTRRPAVWSCSGCGRSSGRARASKVAATCARPGRTPRPAPALAGRTGSGWPSPASAVARALGSGTVAGPAASAAAAAFAAHRQRRQHRADVHRPHRVVAGRVQPPADPAGVDRRVRRRRSARCPSSGSGCGPASGNRRRGRPRAARRARARPMPFIAGLRPRPSSRCSTVALGVGQVRTGVVVGRVGVRAPAVFRPSLPPYRVTHHQDLGAGRLRIGVGALCDQLAPAHRAGDAGGERGGPVTPEAIRNWRRVRVSIELLRSVDEVLRAVQGDRDQLAPGRRPAGCSTAERRGRTRCRRRAGSRPRRSVAGRGAA